MLIHKGFKFKLNPTPEQKQRFREFAGAVRWVWNTMLEERNRHYERTGRPFPSARHNEQFKRLPRLKRHPETAWLKEIHSQVLQEPIKNLQTAFDTFFRKQAEGKLPGGGALRRDGKPKGYPRFKSKKHTKPSFTYPQGVKVNGNRVYLPKIGWVHFYKSREIEGEIKRVTVSRAASGWYVAFNVEVEVAEPVLPEVRWENTVGLDVGLYDLVVDSERKHVEAPRIFRTLEKKLAKAQRHLARKQRGSKRYEKQRRKVARLQEKIANKRRDFLHKVSRGIVDENQVIITEDLHVEGIKRSLRLGKSVSDAALGTFLRMLKYKAEWDGKVYHQIDRFFPSTKLHRACGTLNQVSLSDREFVCQGCGKVIVRDENSAYNVKCQGLYELTGDETYLDYPSPVRDDTCLLSRLQREVRRR